MADFTALPTNPFEVEDPKGFWTASPNKFTKFGTEPFVHPSLKLEIDHPAYPAEIVHPALAGAFTKKLNQSPVMVRLRNAVG